VCSIIKELAWRLRGFIGLTIAIGFPRPLGFSAGLLLVLLAHFGMDFPEWGEKRKSVSGSRKFAPQDRR